MKILRPAIVLLGGFAALLALLYLWASLLKPELSKEPISVAPAERQAAEDLRDVSRGFDDPPVIWQDVDYAEGESAPWYPRVEPPLLAPLVESGQLPPVEERVGPEPLVLQGVEGNGNYGGTWMRVSSSVGDINIITWRMGSPTLVRWSPLGYPIVPHVAKAWEHSEDYREWTFHLRKGMKWSDGEDFNSEDIMYWWTWHIVNEPDSRCEWMTIKGERGEVSAPDLYTIKFTFPHPYTTLLDILAGVHDYAQPEHYLRKYHHLAGDPELIEAAMKATRIPTARGVYGNLRNWSNPECPRLTPWVYRTYRANPPFSIVRNPYFFAVDTEGRQLPYLDRVIFEIKTEKLIANAAASGTLSMQTRYIRYDDYTLLMSNREQNHYSVYHWFSGSRSNWTIFPNLNRYIDPEQPVTQLKAEFLARKEFRQALSLAINRQRIIDAVYNGIGEPAQVSSGRQSPFFYEPLHKSYTEYQPERAAALLDQIGLDQRDDEGYRTFPDGSRMVWFIDVTDFSGIGPAQFVVNDWAKVGVRAVPRQRARTFFQVEKNARKHDFMVWTSESEFHPINEPRSFISLRVNSHGVQAEGWSRWYHYGGLHGELSEDQRKFAIPLPEGHPMRRALELYEMAHSDPTQEARIAHFREIFQIAAENLWTINIATSPPQLVVVADGFHNVPRNALYGATYTTPSNAGLETYYWENPSDSEGAIAQMRQEVLEVTPSPTSVNEETLQLHNRDILGSVIRWLFAGIILAGLVAVGARRPYVGRRLAIMVPTLFVVSVITFIIIQLPPGDYIQAKILEAEMTGDQGALDEVQQLRELFPLDESYVEQYLTWVGFKWFFTFENRHLGLLQGNLGRSMETRRPVNEVVGDRIVLTILISSGTILFTWSLAIPIGIYSAVRQYSFLDYVFTFIGFIGMCVPNFLLALLLIHWSKQHLGLNITGLFSPEYAAQPEWTTGKVIDLLKHIWLPVVVLGVGGTAWMIRVMRGNLLDELRKPYVTTARAKGVRPLKLLLKYPVRLALNPFISGIGTIFPSLISGGAIVAMVLSLPTVGPLMLNALLMEDMYLAGSMLMVLSLLGIFGTLVSDLLLLWLDPRIRVEGGSR